MKEARSAIIVILILLFILVGVGVAISRIADKEKATNTVKTEDQRGFLERIFLKSKSTKTAQKTTTTTKNGGKMVITSETESVEAPSGISDTTGVAGIYDPSDATYESENPESIPATGTPSMVILTSLAGLASGFYIKKRS